MMKLIQVSSSTPSIVFQHTTPFSCHPLFYHQLPVLLNSRLSQSAMQWGVRNEAAAIERYKTITGRAVSFLGFAVHAEERHDWLRTSPDGLLGDGILEVKCLFNKGKPETALPWSTMPFMPQVQGQMEIMDIEWVDLYCWTPNGSTIFRVWRERSYWEIMHEILREFWWENVILAREALSVGREDEAELYKPTSTHRKTGLAIAKSINLAKEAKLLCKEIAGHVQFYRLYTVIKQFAFSILLAVASLLVFANWCTTDED